MYGGRGGKASERDGKGEMTYDAGVVTVNLSVPFASILSFA